MRYWKIRKSMFDHSKASLEAEIESHMDLWDTLYIYFDGNKVIEDGVSKYIVDSKLNNWEKDW